MTNVFGGVTSEGTVAGMLEEAWHEPWYETVRFERAPFAVGALHHGERDPGGFDAWQSDGRLGLLYGTVTNRGSLGLGGGSLFDRVMDDPVSTLARLDGPFCLACLDSSRERAVVAVDKLGARNCYYVPGDRFLFGTAVGPLLAQVDDPTIDHRGLADLLTIGQVWGDRTLVEEARSLPTGHLLEYEAGDVSVRPYRRFEFTRTGGAGYVDELVERYRAAIRRASETIDARTGLWLSGGLDSRALGAVLSRCGHLDETFTYDDNPPGRNRDIARRVAEVLDVPNREVLLTPSRLLDRLDDIVSALDGLIPWISAHGLSASFDVPDEVGVVLEACGQGVLVGSGVWRHDVEQGSDAADILYRAEHFLGVDATTQLLRTDVDPMETYRDAVTSSSGPDQLGRALAALHRYYFQRGDFLSNRLARTQHSTRVPFVDEALLSHLERLPDRFRERTVPFTAGRIPFGCAPLKLELVRRIDPELATIPYSRSFLSAARPLWQHAVGFVASTAYDHLRSRPAHGGKELTGEWYRDHPRFRRRLDGLLDAARSRPVFDADEIDRRRDAHLSGESEEIMAISAVTTAEHWFQRHVDRA